MRCKKFEMEKNFISEFRDEIRDEIVSDWKLFHLKSGTDVFIADFVSNSLNNFFLYSLINLNPI